MGSVLLTYPKDMAVVQLVRGPSQVQGEVERWYREKLKFGTLRSCDLAHPRGPVDDGNCTPMRT